ncbi:MAG TPA: hypothetical protein VFB73_00930 [Chloroflexota bacterium]|nr:hypothetical protein [Chloroflexota bacterium]
MGEPAFGAELYGDVPVATLVAEAQLAERLGYRTVWLGDAQLLWRELYVSLGSRGGAHRPDPARHGSDHTPRSRLAPW